VPFPALDPVSKVHDDIFTKFLFFISEISLAMLENRDNLPEWNCNLSEYAHLFLNQLGYNYLDEANFYSRWELERFSVLLEKYPEKFKRLVEILKKKTREINEILQNK